MDTVTQIFDELGGPAAVARIIGSKPSTASEMKRRSSIPVQHWLALIAALDAKGVKIDEARLVKMHTEAHQ